MNGHAGIAASAYGGIFAGRKSCITKMVCGALTHNGSCAIIYINLQGRLLSLPLSKGTAYVSTICAIGAMF